MSTLSRIFKAAESFKAPSIVVIARLCTHRHHQASSCSRCVEVCPAEAVTVSAEGPSVDTLSCADCGACASACPTGALAALRPTDQTLAERIVAAAQPGGRVTLACARAMEESAGAVKMGCLTRLDPSLLLVAFAQGAAVVTLCTGACDACAMKEAAPQLSSVVVETRRVLEAFGLTGAVLVEERLGGSGEPGSEESGPEELEVAPVAAEDRSRPGGLRSTVVTRRGFFDVLRHGGTYAAAQAAGMLAGHADTVVDEGPRRELLVRASTKRERLLDALRVLRPDSAPSPQACDLFAAPRIDGERCDRCGLCGRLCPTGALTLTEDEKGNLLRLSCRAEACVACGLCVEICGREAVTLEAAPADRVLARAAEPVTLVERAEPAAGADHGMFEDKINATFEDKMQALLGVPIRRS